MKEDSEGYEPVFSESKESGMPPLSSCTQKEEDTSGLFKFSSELNEKEGIKTETLEDKYLTLENLIQDIHDNPPRSSDGKDNISEIIRTNEHKKYGLLPLIVIKEKSVKNKEVIKKVVFGLRYTEENSDNFRRIDGLGIALKDEIIPRENIGEEVFREYLLLDRKQFGELEKLTYSGKAKKEREERLNILDQDATAGETYKALIKAAIKQKASDIHIEPYSNKETRIRFRKDGVLQIQDYKGITGEKRKRLIQVIKGQGKVTLDVAENRRPQDGQINIKTKEIEKESNDDILIDLDTNERYNLRVSLVNTNHGEKAVLRILKSQEKAFNLKKLGYPEKVYQEIRDLIQSPNGIIMLTGPTGSGKTTSLYAMLEERNTNDVNITTVEDPIEIDLPGINQLQLNKDAGITFPVCLRSILRQDPDIILIGEIRDKETAEIAAQSAKTGHLVFSTLHARDAIDTLLRLQDFKIENRDVATLVGVVSQRLVRRLCKECKQSYSGRKEINDMFGEEIIKESTTFYKRPDSQEGKICKNCNGIGYKGRVVIPELWIIGNEEREMIEAGEKRHSEYLKLALKKGMNDLTYNGLRRIIGGHTSLDELFRAAINKKDFLDRKYYVQEIIPKINKEKEEKRAGKNPGDTSVF